MVIILKSTYRLDWAKDTIFLSYWGLDVNNRKRLMVLVPSGQRACNSNLFLLFGFTAMHCRVQHVTF